MKRTTGLMLACSFAAMVASTTAALAQQVDAAEASDRNADGTATGGLEEIVVTAQKRAESLQSVPISVTAVTGEAVENLKATDLKGLQGTIPNIQINNFTNTPNSAVFTIRGIGVVEPDPFAGNTVSIVQDGVPQFFSMGALLDLFDVERIEVLRGPQGTLFGANTTGGVVSVLTRQPTGEAGIRGEFTYGNYDRLDAKVAADLPIVDGVLAGKIAAMHSRRDGFYTNIVNGNDLGSKALSVVRAYLRFTPSASVDATLSGEYGASRNGAPVVVNGSRPGDLIYITPGTTGPGQVLPMYASPCVPSIPCQAPDKYFSGHDNVPNRSDMDTYRATLTVNINDTAIGDITSISGYKKFVIHEYSDVDAVPGLYIDTSRHTRGWQISQELRTALDVSDA
ncbi:MAG: TonB-dependent receptor, partial [Pseudomonadota bacterium]